MTAGIDRNRAEFECGCYIRVNRELTLTLWQCAAGNNCEGWRLIVAELERCMTQLRMHVLGRAL